MLPAYLNIQFLKNNLIIIAGNSKTEEYAKTLFRRQLFPFTSTSIYPEAKCLEQT